MRILVTGGAGYIGTVLVPELLRSGHRVTILESFAWGTEPIQRFVNNPKLEIVRGDVREPHTVATAMHGVDAVVHLAAIVGYPACDADPAHAVSTNVFGMHNVVRQLD